MGAVDEEIKVLRATFVEVFRPANPQPFGSPTLGLSDGNSGVQWNAGIDPKSGLKPEVAYVGVNLEGKEYDDWPIASLIKREHEDPKLVETIAKLQQSNEIWLMWSRDAWTVGGSRTPAIKEKDIAPTPTRTQ